MHAIGQGLTMLPIRQRLDAHALVDIGAGAGGGGKRKPH